MDMDLRSVPAYTPYWDPALIRNSKKYVIFVSVKCLSGKVTLQQ